MKILTKRCQKNAKKSDFFSKKSRFLTFLVTNLKKPFLVCVLTWFSSNFSIFNSKLLFLACHKNFWRKKWFFFTIFSKISIFSIIWYQKRILWLISVLEMYPFIYITVIDWKLQHSIGFNKIWVHTPFFKTSHNCWKNWKVAFLEN